MKKVNLSTLTHIFMGFFVFLSINIPSIKLLYSSPIINFIALLGILGLGFFRMIFNMKDVAVNITKNQINFLFLFWLYWIIMFISTIIYSNSILSVMDIIEYLSIIFFVTGITLFVKNLDLKFLFNFQIIWGIVLAVFEYTVGIPKNLNLGQHYLTSGVAIGLTIVMLFGHQFVSKVNKIEKITIIIFLIILLLGVTSLPGRSPIILSLLIPLIVFIISIITRRNGIKLISGIIGLYFVISLLRNTFTNLLSDYTINRFINLFTSYEDESRYVIYNEAMNLILDNPFGYGLKGYNLSSAIYPHNIVLETILTGGVFALIPFGLIIFALFKHFWDDVKIKRTSLIYSIGFIFLFFVWNISFDLSTAYILFNVMSLYHVSRQTT